MAKPLSKYEYAYIDFDNPKSLLAYAKKLEGHTFQEVLDLGITPDGLVETNDYSSKAFKDGMPQKRRASISSARRHTRNCNE